MPPKALDRHACGKAFKGLSTLSLSYEGNHTETESFTFFIKIFQKSESFPLISAIMCIKMVGGFGFDEIHPGPDQFSY